MRKREKVPDLYCSQCRGSEYDVPRGRKILRCKLVKGHPLMEVDSKEAMTCGAFEPEGPIAAGIRERIMRKKRGKEAVDNREMRGPPEGDATKMRV